VAVLKTGREPGGPYKRTRDPHKSIDTRRSQKKAWRAKRRDLTDGGPRRYFQSRKMRDYIKSCIWKGAGDGEIKATIEKSGGARFQAKINRRHRFF